MEYTAGTSGLHKHISKCLKIHFETCKTAFGWGSRADRLNTGEIQMDTLGCVQEIISPLGGYLQQSRTIVCTCLLLISACCWWFLEAVCFRYLEDKYGAARELELARVLNDLFWYLRGSRCSQRISSRYH